MYILIYIYIYINILYYIYHIEFLTLCTKLSHDKLKSKLSSIFEFDFKGADKTFIRLSNNSIPCWEEKIKGGIGFSKTSFKATINHVIKNCFVNVGNVTMKEAISIPLGTAPTSFWEILFLYSSEEEFISSLISFDKIKARHQ